MTSQIIIIASQNNLDGIYSIYLSICINNTKTFVQILLPLRFSGDYSMA
jgi:hypothetical protein